MKTIILSVMTLIIVAVTPNASANDVEFLKLYLRIQEEVAKCPDASCFKGVFSREEIMKLDQTQYSISHGLVFQCPRG